jgi:hypothetical protein
VFEFGNFWTWQMQTGLSFVPGFAGIFHFDKFLNGLFGASSLQLLK